MKGTGGNRFIDGDATPAVVMSQIWRQLDELEAYAAEDGRTFDIGDIAVETKRVKDRISVTVTANLANPHAPNQPQGEPA